MNDHKAEKFARDLSEAILDGGKPPKPLKGNWQDMNDRVDRLPPGFDRDPRYNPKANGGNGK